MLSCVRVSGVVGTKSEGTNPEVKMVLRFLVADDNLLEPLDASACEGRRQGKWLQQKRGERTSDLARNDETKRVSVIWFERLRRGRSLASTQVEEAKDVPLHSSPKRALFPAPSSSPAATAAKSHTCHRADPRRPQKQHARAS